MRETEGGDALGANVGCGEDIIIIIIIARRRRVSVVFFEIRSFEEEIVGIVFVF